MSSVLSALYRPLIRFLDRGSLPKYEGDLTIAGLRSGVRVLWGAYGIPQIFAANEHDLFLAQGYLHAQERLWQMDMSRRFLAGRIAEVFGNFAVPWQEISSQFRGRRSADFDYFMRIMSIRDAAGASLKLLTGENAARLQAYSDGVNRYIQQCAEKLPWEFRVLRYQAEPWSPEDSLTIIKGLAFLVSTALFTRLNLLALAARLEGQPDKLRSLCPAYPVDGPAITQAHWNSTRGIWQFANSAFATGCLNSPGHGSNGWVIASQRSASGNAALCNDPHLRMTVPSIWYLMHLHSRSSPERPDGYEVWGASVPGSPYIQLGRNRWIAWGATAALCDDGELYREKIHPLEPDLVLSGHEWQRLRRREEIIRIRGAKPIKVTVRSTRHGPVLSDCNAPNRSSVVLTFRWAAHEPSQELVGLYQLNQARHWTEFLGGLSHHAAPALNYVFADQRGNIGYSVAGKIPIRPQTPPLIPLDGWNEANDWQGYIPFSELPRLYNPPEGLIATANNQIVDRSYPYYLSHFFEPPYRINRIKELLGAKKLLSIDDLKAMQIDVVSLHARETIQTLKMDLAAIGKRNPIMATAVDRILAWDGGCHERSVESSIFHVFYHRLVTNLLIPDLGEELFSAYVEIFNQSLAPIERILKNPNSEWFASLSRAELVFISFREAIGELTRTLGGDMEQWHWGRIHALTLAHNLGRIAGLDRFLSLGPFPSPGDGTTLNLGFYRRSFPYRHTVGASLRFIVDLGRREYCGAVLPSGQSGHPSSRHYRDQSDLWRNGQLINFVFSDDETGMERCLNLKPNRGAVT